MPSLNLFNLTLILISLFTSTLAQTPVQTQNTQYCRFGHSTGQADFCLGLSVTNHSNPTPNHDFHLDFHLSLSVRRSSPLGWTAIGTGPQMANSIMIIIYGDPGKGKPIVSVRTVNGHHQPQAIDFTATGNAEFKAEKRVDDGGRITVVMAEWEKLIEGKEAGRRHDDEKEEHHVPTGPPAHAARIEILCEKCDKFGSVQGWGGAGKAGSMPWIWAHNDNQDFTHDGGQFTVDAKLKMHRHRESSGGYGRFWVDMTRAFSADVKAQHDWDFEERASNERIGTSDGPIGFGASFDFVVRVWSLAKIHGVAMGLGFLVLFPLGVVMIRLNSGKGRPFKRHWRVQVVATAVAVVGAMIGGKLSKWHMPKTLHQWLGVGIVIGLIVQSVLGLKHHVDFAKIKRRTWVSYGHIWLGRLVVAGGLVNAALGMLLSGRGAGSIWLAAVMGLIEAAGLGYWLRRAETQRKKTLAGDEDGTEALALMPRNSDGGENYFALDESEEESDLDSDEDEDEDTKMSDEEALPKKSVGSVKKGLVGEND